MLPLLRLFGRGTWKCRPKRSVRSSSSLELEFSSVRMPLDRPPYRFKLLKGDSGLFIAKRNANIEIQNYP